MTDNRKPNIYIYNPTCEIAIANGTLSFMPNKTLSKFESDLDALPLYFTNCDDVLLVRQVPDEKFLELISSVGVELPHFKLVDEALHDRDFVRAEKNSLQAWGWSPRIHHILKPFKESCCANYLDQPNAYWQEKHRDLYGRATALGVLKSFLKHHASGIYIDSGKIARVCTNESEIECLIEEWKQLVIKAPLSSSGRGLQVMRYSYLNDSIRQWIKGTLDSQEYVCVEALLNKKYDFSLQYYCDGKGKLSYLGPGFFLTSSNGQYEGNMLGAMPAHYKEYLTDARMADLSLGMKAAIEESDLATNYCGYFGVDCLLFEDENGQMKIQPCIEINLRYNMGTLALELSKYLADGTTGVFKIIFKPKSSFDEFHKEMEKKYPFEMRDGKWAKGYLPLVSPYQNKSFGVYILLE